MLLRALLVLSTVCASGCFRQCAVPMTLRESISPETRPNWDDAKIEQLSSADLLGAWLWSDGYLVSAIEIKLDSTWRETFRGCIGTPNEVSGTWAFRDGLLHLDIIGETKFAGTRHRIMKPIAKQGVLGLAWCDHEGKPAHPNNPARYLRVKKAAAASSNSR